ncbi:MAG: hypothetical protein HW380_1648 [Magnetococcales bacterium]|nr:hypothetical protein [Magnetococcales bacterium]
MGATWGGKFPSLFFQIRGQYVHFSIDRGNPVQGIRVNFGDTREFRGHPTKLFDMNCFGQFSRVSPELPDFGVSRSHQSES